MRRIFLRECISKNAGVADYSEAFYQFHMHLHMKYIIVEIDKSRCVSYFSTVPKVWGDISKRKEKERDEYLKKASCIVLISNVREEEQEDIELVQIYKGQQVVENSFRELKSSSMASVIYLKNSERIKALSMLLSLSHLIRSIIQYQMREGLKEFNNENPGVKLRAGWGGRTLENPTYRLLYEHSVYFFFDQFANI